MAGMNLVFHVLAMLVFIALSFFLLRLQKKLQFLKELCLSQKDYTAKRPLLDWPGRYIQKFCRSFDIPITSPRQSLWFGSPRLIDQAKIFKFFLKYGLKRVSMAVTNQNLTLTIICHKLPENLASEQSEIKRSLGMQVDVTICL